MSEYDPGTEDYGHEEHHEPHHDEADVIVAQWTDGSTATVVDVDHDKQADIVGLDEEGDGYHEVVITDEYGEGRDGEKLDTIYIDEDQNRHYETRAADTDGDGVPDLISHDEDQDGKYTTVHYGDTDENPFVHGDRPTHGGSPYADK